MQVKQLDEQFEVSAKPRNIFLAMVAVGFALLLFAFTQEATRQRAWANFLIGNYYTLALALSSVLFLAIQYTTRASWAIALRRIPEAISRYLPIAGILMLLIYFGIHDLYHWAHPGIMQEDALLAKKAAFLNEKFFMIRMAGAILLWILLAKIMVKNSELEDATGEVKYYNKNFRASCIFLLVYGPTFCLAAFDWIMTLEPHWFSTIFGVYNFVGMFVNGITVITLITVLLKEKGHLSNVNENHLHDLGKLMFAFSVFWAYIWFSQLMLIWYSNIPEEVVYYHTRWQQPFVGLFWLNFGINFLFPFFVLMTRDAKRNPQILKLVALVLIIGHWLDIYLMVMPGTLGEHSSITWVEIASFIGFAGLFSLVFIYSLAKQKLMANKVAYLEESLSYHQ